MAILVTGAAGFIGFHTVRTLLARGESVVGIDNLGGDYPALQQARLAELAAHRGFRFHRVDIADFAALEAALAGEDFDHAVHLAAQPGVRQSLERPQSCVAANVAGHLNVLEVCRHRRGLKHLVYASSSSVYGGGAVPFREAAPADQPYSLYAATKRADEMMSHAYAHLYGIPQTGLRFFTVYGPWGRPDMAVWLFTDAILAGRPIRLFNGGRMRRDFTYVDDIVGGVLTVLERPPAAGDEARHRVYNFGGSRSEELGRLVALIEQATGRTAEIELLPMQPGDAPETLADISALAADHPVRLDTPLEAGIPRFVAWYRSHFGI